MRVLIAAGGTAGHINPALAIAGALKQADPAAEIHFAGRREGMEYGLVTKAGYPFHHIEINGFQRKLSVQNIGRNLMALYHLALSGPRTAAILKEVRPDLVIGCVLIPGAKAPKLVTEEMVQAMRPGSAIVDVAIDQGGSIETIDRITTHKDPCFVKHGVLHYSVANMPGGVPRTSTLALTGATLPYALKLANLGAEAACKADPALRKGLNVYYGKMTCRNVAESQKLEYVDPTTLF